MTNNISFKNKFYVGGLNENIYDNDIVSFFSKNGIIIRQKDIERKTKSHCIITFDDYKYNLQDICHKMHMKILKETRIYVNRILICNTCGLFGHKAQYCDNSSSLRKRSN